MTEKSIFFEFERCGNDLICAPEQQGIFSGCSVLNRLFNLSQFHYVAYLFNRVCFSTGKSVKKCDGCR